MVQFEGVTETLTVQGVDESTHRTTERLGGGGGREGGREGERERSERKAEKRRQRNAASDILYTRAAKAHLNTETSTIIFLCKITKGFPPKYAKKILDCLHFTCGCV